MKKHLLFAMIATIITIVTTSCASSNEPISYPENLIGFWASAANAEQQWYGLDVIDDTTATLIKYEIAESIAMEDMVMTYSQTDGKGKVEGAVKYYNLQVTSDSTFTLLMEDGITTFTKTTKPEEQFSLIGYWKENTTEPSAMNLLFFPKNEQDTTFATIVIEDKEDQSLRGMMAKIINFDEETLTGTIVNLNNTNLTFAIAADGMNNLNFTFGDTMYLTKQPRASVTVGSIEGIWKASLSALIEMTIAVDSKQNCEITYNKTGSKGTAKGVVHYCSHAGMGVLVPTEYELSEDLMELFAHFECGIFKIKSKREISVSLTSIGYPEEVIFTKQ